MPLSIEKILTGAPMVKKEGAFYVFPEEQDANAYIALGHEVLQISRIAKVELGSEVSFATHKGECYYFAAEQIVGFRFGSSDTRHKLGGAGFTNL